MSFFNSPAMLVLILVIFLITYFVFLDLEGSFTSDFLQVGPSKDVTNMSYFMGIKIDSWTKVILIYGISFLTGALSTAYEISTAPILSSVYIPDAALVDQSVSSIYTITLLSPFIAEALNIVELFTGLTLQFQFIIPGIIGRTIVHVPYILSVLASKTVSA
jgi:hypothetical protein